MTRLAHFIIRHRFAVIGAWAVMTALGAYSAGQVADRWLEDFSIPGASGYEANQRAVAELGNGELFPFVIVLRADEDVTKVPGVEAAIDKTAETRAPASAPSSTRGTTCTSRLTARSRSRTSTGPASSPSRV